MCFERGLGSEFEFPDPEVQAKAGSPCAGGSGTKDEMRRDGESGLL